MNERQIGVVTLRSGDSFSGGGAPFYFYYSWGLWPYGIMDRDQLKDVEKRFTAWELLEKTVWQRKLSRWKGKPGLKILELGSGAGKLTNLLVENFPEASITAIDMNRNLIAWSQSLWSEVSFIYGDCVEMEKLTTGLGPFDLILSSMLVNQLNDEQFYSIIESARLALSPNGEFICLIPDLEEKAKQHGIPTMTNTVIVEDAPWGGMTEYYHHSDQLLILMKYFYQAGIKRFSITELGSWTVHFLSELRSEGVDPDRPSRMMLSAQGPRNEIL